MTKIYRAHISTGFDLNEIQFLRILGQGMSGSVSQLYFINKSILKNCF